MQAAHRADNPNVPAATLPHTVAGRHCRESFEHKAAATTMITVNRLFGLSGFLLGGGVWLASYDRIGAYLDGPAVAAPLEPLAVLWGIVAGSLLTMVTGLALIGAVEGALAGMLYGAIIRRHARGNPGSGLRLPIGGLLGALVAVTFAALFAAALLTVQFLSNESTGTIVAFVVSGMQRWSLQYYLAHGFTGAICGAVAAACATESVYNALAERKPSHSPNCSS